MANNDNRKAGAEAPAYRAPRIDTYSAQELQSALGPAQAIYGEP